MTEPPSAQGRVYLVGAGPGDPGLMTARALELLSRADVVLSDRLVGAGALEGVRADAIVIDVGKQGGGASVPQEDTERLMLEHARAGRSVVRLKGGDPFVFGRGGEEALALRAEGIEFEIVPGITSGVAAPAYAGIPVTQRELASAVALVTGHEDPTKPETALDWQALAAFPGTLVFYMGVGQLAHITAQLVAGGRPAGEPAAIVQEGTLPGQRVVTGTLGTLAERARAVGVKAPAVTVVGSVAALADQIAWRGRGPLAGRTVAVTRARPQASALAERLRRLGAAVVEAPAIEIAALPGEAPDLGPYDLVCLTSVNGVRYLFERLMRSGRDARALAGTKVAAVGPGTAAALAERGVRADIVPERFVAEALVESLRGVPVRRALVARARGGRDVLPDALRERGADVDVLDLYETLPRALDEPTRAAAARADYLIFTSASTVRHFLQAAGGAAAISDRTRVVSIGPITTAAAGEHGVRIDLEAPRADLDGLVAAILADAS